MEWFAEGDSNPGCLQGPGCHEDSIGDLVVQTAQAAHDDTTLPW
jgi:hypothetical protein